MENYPCVNATNIRLGSLIKYIDNNDKFRMAIVCDYKCCEIIDYNSITSDYHSYIIQCVDNNEKLNITFVNKKGFYHYLLVVSY
jgi:hypothetical protein